MGACAARAALLLSFLPLLACAPVAVMRPASGVTSGRCCEVGAAAARLGPRPYVDESAELTGQTWFTFEPERWLALSAIAAFDDSAAAGGLAARWNALRTSRVALGPEVELGYAWAATSLGFAVRPIADCWIYTAPRFGTLGATWAIGVPVGVSIGTLYGFGLRAEWQRSWADLLYYNRREHLAAGVFYQF
jgi:hypothetical protein